jgi:hypothetical protein
VMEPSRSLHADLEKGRIHHGEEQWETLLLNRIKENTTGLSVFYIDKKMTRDHDLGYTSNSSRAPI